jgi:hypothetical protein
MDKEVTWEELADIYKKETGKSAKIKPMQSIFEWALSRVDLFKPSTDDGLIYIGGKDVKHR